MATLAENRDERGNAIISYYNNLQTYNTNLEEDGTNAEGDKPQARFKAFNDLIKLYHRELQIATGYLYNSSDGYVDPEENNIPNGFWWRNAKITNLRSEWFYADAEKARNDYEFYYLLNTKNDPLKRHPYLYWNQYGSELGSFDEGAWKNTSSKSSYTDTQNPFATGTDFRMAEPLEHYGDENNLLWGSIVFDGRWAYRSQHIGNTSYTTHTTDGFYDYQSNDRPIHNFLTSHDDSNRHPSPWQTFYNTFWGDGSNTTLETGVEISSHSGTTSGEFRVLGFSGPSFTVDNWYMIYTNSTGYGYIFRYTGSHIEGTEPNEYTVYEYDDANWPNPDSGDFDSTGVTVIEHPAITESIKTGSTSDGRRNVWSSIYDQYYSNFSSAIDSVTSAAQEWSSRLSDIIDFDYTIISDSDVAGEELFKSDTQSFKSSLDDWITAWQGLTGSFSTFDSKWSNSYLDSLLSDGSGGLDQVIAFSSDYGSSQSGLLADRRDDIYNTIVGEYSKGSDEDWSPSITTFAENNSGNFTAGTLNWYRHNYANSRLNREDGLLTVAYSSWKTYNEKFSLVSDLEAEMDPVVTDSKYDITPTGLAASTDVEDAIELEWDDTKAAASYDIEYKEGLSGSWTTLVSNFGYVDPGSPPDFSESPDAEYEHQAYTLGYQDISVTYSDIEDSTGLSDDFTRYYFDIALDGNSAVTTNVRGMDAQTWEALAVALNDRFEEDEIEATAEITPDAVRIYSNTIGSSSSVSLSAGSTNDLIAALSGSLLTPVAGTTNLEPGKVYYYRLKVNNGYDVSLGSDGNEEDKDWNSQSDWQYELYSNDQMTHGDAGYIVWPDPDNLVASGVNLENGLTPSDAHTRLEWDGAPNASSYKIYRATTIDGGYALIGSTSDTFYEDTTGIPGFAYYYRVRAIADSDYQTFDENGNLSGPIVSALTSAVRGKRLWQTITLDVTTDNRDEMVLSWSDLSGATGYLIYRSTVENGPHEIMTNDDATDMIISGTTYVDKAPARQFTKNTYSDPTDGISDTDYDANQRYYFIVAAVDSDGNATLRQYFIKAPASGTWEAQDIVDAIDEKLTSDLNNVDCELVPMENLSDDTTYKIRFKTHLETEAASIEILDGTFGPSLLPLLGDTERAIPGGSALPGINYYYRVQAVEVIDGEQVRASELSDVVLGFRPII